jgi:hypothetical protein
MPPQCVRFGNFLDANGVSLYQPRARALGKVSD